MCVSSGRTDERMWQIWHFSDEKVTKSHRQNTSLWKSCLYCRCPRASAWSLWTVESQHSQSQEQVRPSNSRQKREQAAKKRETRVKKNSGVKRKAEAKAEAKEAAALKRQEKPAMKRNANKRAKRTAANENCAVSSCFSLTYFFVHVFA